MFTAQIAKAREASVKALNAADEIRKGATVGDDGRFDSETQESFDRAMTDFTEQHKSYLGLVAEQTKIDQLDKGLTDFTEPSGDAGASSVQLHGERGGENSASTGPAGEWDAERKRKEVNEALKAWAQEGQDGMVPDHRKRFMQGQGIEGWALTGEVDQLGGFAVPEDMQNEFVKELAGFAAIRPIARVRTTKTDHANFLTAQGSGNIVYSTGVSGAWRKQAFVTGGTAPPTQDEPTFGTERVGIHSWVPDVIEIPVELLEDASLDLEGEIRTLLAEVAALDEDSAFILGDGNGKPEGLMNAGISTVNSGDANLLTYGGLVDIRQGLPAQYRSRGGTRWLMNSATYGEILKLEDSQNRPIFQPNMLIDKLWGIPIVFSEFMADVGAAAEPILLGDFGFYAIADRMDLRFTRLVERFTPNIGISAHKRVGGQVLKTAAFRTQTISA